MSPSLRHLLISAFVAASRWELYRAPRLLGPPGGRYLVAGYASPLAAEPSFILAFAHRWREPRRFFLLLGLSFLGFVVFAVLHNVFYAIGESSNTSWGTSLMEVLHVGSFLVAVLICPPGILVGLIGYFVAGFRARKSHAHAPSA